MSQTHAMGDPLRILSLGGGTQSCALALMSAAGDLPKLDHIIFADTQGELPETYAYLDYLRSVVEPAGIPLHVVTAGSLEKALLIDHAINHNPTPPAHVRNPDGTHGRIGQYRCSYDYKRRIIERQVKALCGGRGDWKRSTVEQWIGFSLEETSRMRVTSECRCGHKLTGGTRKEPVRVHAPACIKCKCEGFDPWQVNRWPLIELGMKRHDTIRWFAAHDHPTPPRSACWFCPNQGNGRWQALRARGDDLWDRACTIDETIRDGGGFNKRGKTPFEGKLYLHNSVTPLREADLRTELQVIADSGQDSLFDDVALGLDCEAGVCFT
jgi:hypothetical protein